MAFTRWKTLGITGFCGKLPRGVLRRPRGRDRAADGKRGRGGGGGGGHPEADSLSRANLAANTHGWLAYSPMRRSCAGGMRGGDGERTSPPVTVP